MPIDSTRLAPFSRYQQTNDYHYKINSDETSISLDYRMGEYWNAEAVEGLFEIMALLKSMSSDTTIKHLGNYFDYEQTILLSAFNDWLAVKQISLRLDVVYRQK